MNKNEAIRKLEEHPAVMVLIFGVVLDGEKYIHDAVACCTKEEFDKEAKRFVIYRKFVFKKETK